MNTERSGCEFRACILLSAILVGACVPFTDEMDVTRPDTPGNLVVVAQTDTPDMFEGLSAILTAEATGGAAPYLYRWDQNAGAAELTLADVTADTLTTDPLTTPGRYVFRVVVTDYKGSCATAYVAVEVREAVVASAPKLVVVGEPVDLSAELAAEAEGAALTWEVVRGTASLEDENSSNPMLTTAAGETVEVLLTVTLPSTGELPVATTRLFEIVSVHDLHPQVLIETNFGDFTLELNGELAPLHTVNFLLYVDEGFYDGLLFHRSACTPNLTTGDCEPFVLQGGGYKRVDGELKEVEPTRDPVPSEADNGLSNTEVYSVSLALTAGDPNSGTTQFFINLADNGFLDGRGFTVFAAVVDGTEVVDAIVAAETTDSPIIPGEVSLPVEDVIIEHVSRVGP